MATIVATDLMRIAERCAKEALSRGARDVAAAASRGREVTVEWRDGRLEQVKEATTRAVSLQLYVDGKYSLGVSSDLREEALRSFIADAVAMARSLEKDPFRALPDPDLYRGQSQVILELEDAAFGSIKPEDRRARAREMEEAARSVKDSASILSVTTTIRDHHGVTCRVHSNGFSGEHRSTSFGVSAAVTVKDPDGRRPEEGSGAGARRWADLPSHTAEAIRASERALARRGSRKIPSGKMPMVLENRVAGRLVSALLAPLSASQLQQKRSFLEGKIGQQIGSELFAWTDDPLIVRGLGSRLFDGEGIAAGKMAIFDRGVLRSYFVDNYYGRKLKLRPTTGGPSNAVFTTGERPLAKILSDVKEGIFVTGFLGGNSNSTTGDFSFGITGFAVRAGQLAEPVSEMNISGNLAGLFRNLVAVGNDPYPHSTARTPTLVFEGTSFSGV